jgi:hypothetical protein
MTSSALVVVCVWLAAEAPGRDAELARLAKQDLPAFAREVSRGADSELGKTQAVVGWLTKNFRWTATDYERRSVAQIVERGGGNCFELSQVALACLEALKIPMRQVKEINIHEERAQRGETARAMVKEKGNAMSVFGRHHNDHVWLEVHDGKTGEWYPADPSMGLVGTTEWLRARVGFGERSTLNPGSSEMIVPFAVVAQDDRGAFTVSRTHHYLVEGFSRLYGGALEKLPAWKDWTRLVGELDGKAQGAFRGEVNLHLYEAQIDELARTYQALEDAYRARASR